MFLYFPVINAEEFIRSGCYVDIVRLALYSLFVHKGVNGVNASKGSQRPTVCKTCHITDFSRELEADTMKCYDKVVTGVANKI